MLPYPFLDGFPFHFQLLFTRPVKYTELADWAVEDCVNALLQAFAFPRRELAKEILRMENVLMLFYKLLLFHGGRRRTYEYKIKSVNALLQAFAFPPISTTGRFQ